MEQINIMEYIDVKYVIVVTLTVYLYLSRIVRKPSKLHQHISSFIIGGCLGFVWIKYKDANIDQIVISFLIVELFWNKILSPILKAFGTSYDNGKGIIK